MATEAMTLPDERLESGLAILHLTDSIGFDAVGAGWGFTRSTGSWRFYLFTDLIDTKGPSWVWERLLKAFKKLELPAGITPLDIMLASPDEWLYRRVLTRMDDTAGGLAPVVSSGEIRQYEYGIDRLWLIRARPEQAVVEEAAYDSTAGQFDQKIRQLMAA